MRPHNGSPHLTSRSTTGCHACGLFCEQTLPLSIARTQVAADSTSTSIIATTTTVAFGCKPSFAIFPSVDDIL